MHMHIRDHDNMLVLYALTQWKGLLNIDGVHVVGGKMHSFPWLALSDMTYAIVVSVPAEYDRYV
jgi:hypothetical protein